MPQPTRQQTPPQQEGNGAPQNPLAAAVESLLNIGEGLQKEKAALLDRIGANRDTLRNLAKQGAATGEQAAKIRGMYPDREVSDEAKRKRAEKAAAKRATANAGS